MTEITIVEAVPLIRGDSHAAVPYRAIIANGYEVIGVAREGHYLLHADVRKLMGFAVIDSGLAADYSIVGTWDNGREALIEATLERPVSPEYGVRPQYWVFNDCVSGEILVWAGVLALHSMLGTDVTQPVFVLYPSKFARKIKGETYASQLNAVAKGMVSQWNDYVLPWVANLSSSYCNVDALIRQIRDNTNVSKKYLDAAEADFRMARGTTCWQYMVTLSASIDQMNDNLFRRLDLRQRANRPVNALLASLGANNNQGGIE